MILSKVVALTGLVGLAQQATAYNSHRHLHNQQKTPRKLIVDKVVVEEVVYVQPEPEPTPTTSTTSTSSSVVPTTTSTSTTSTPPPPPPSSSTTSVSSLTENNAAVDVSASLSVSISVGPEESPTNTAVIAPVPTTSVSTGSSSGSSSSSGSGSSSGSKRGIAYNDGVLADIFAEACGENCGWCYDWNQDPMGAKKCYFQPMLWGNAPEHTENWFSSADSALANGATYLLSCNEPDNAGQANMTPSEAVALQVQYFQRYIGKAKISSCAITSNTAPNTGTDWLKQFLDECGVTDGCQVDRIACHWYGLPDQVDDLISYLEEVYQIANLPLLLTEYGLAGDTSDSDTVQFLEETLERLEKLDYVELHAFFFAGNTSTVSSQNMFNEFNELSGFASTYIS
jgi:hypothetical protein